jgi:hypothetical protein
MALKIYTDVNENTELSIDGTFTNPLLVTFDGRTGGTVEQLLYLRQDTNAYIYTGITLSVEQFGVEEPNLLNGNDGFYIKLHAGDSQPTIGEWATLSGGNSISLPDPASKNIYLPFWIYIKVPAGISIQQFRNVRFNVGATVTEAGV